MSEKIFQSTKCDGCGAPLHPIPGMEFVECEYCGTHHEMVERYRGPKIPDSLPSYGYVFASGSSLSTCTVISHTYQTTRTDYSPIWISNSSFAIG
jgi:DNA-directed RNA polymerase subunit RPC12/RpoP